MARAVRHRRFDRPHIDRARAEVSATMRAPGGRPRPVRTSISARSTSSSPARCRCVPILAEDDLLAATADARAAARGAHPPLLQDPRARADVDASAPTASCASAYVHRGRRDPRASRSRAGRGALAEALATVGAAAGDVEAPDTAVVDLYLPLAGDQPAGRRRRCRPSWPRPSRAADLPGAGAAGRADRLARRRGARDVLTFRRRRRRRRAAVLDGGRPGRGAGRRPGPLRGGRQVPRPAPDDRPAPADVAPGQLRDHAACRRPATSTSSTAWPGRTRPTSGSSPWPRCATSRRCATRPGGRWPCPRSRACSSPRSTPSVRRCAERPELPRLEWNRIMLYVWPPSTCRSTS